MEVIKNFKVTEGDTIKFQVAKEALPIIAMLIGIVIALGAFPDTTATTQFAKYFLTVLKGCTYGLIAMGLWSGSKATIGK